MMIQHEIQAVMRTALNWICFMFKTVAALKVDIPKI